MTCDIYVSEEANNRSPQLVPQQINYKVVDEPPPFASDADCDKGTHDRPRKPHPPEFQLQRREGDGALMRITGPDKLEAATRAEQRPLYRFPKQSKVQYLDRIPGDLLPPLTTPILEGYKEESPQSAQRTLPPLIPSQDPNSKFSSQRTCLLSLAAISTGPPIISVPYPRTSTTEGLSPYSKSPDLQTRISLPSLQSLALDTSCDTQSLPSIHSALGFLQCEFSSAQTSGVTPPYSYSQFATSHESSARERQLPNLSPRVPPGLLSHPSLISTTDIYVNASPVSEPSFWRTPTPAVSIKMQHPPPPSSDPNHHAFSMTATTPATKYPTPTETVVPAAGKRVSSSSQTVPKNGSTTTNIGEYKCTHSGCTAAPFQTQYTLNSHANVHSSDRTYFCSVEGCRRGVGGEGFKRKNEMTRHGLVHYSPGYVCPFCADQRHKYPRPDNLQRHVRTHHADKSKDDPILGEILAQKFTGKKKGRRRRLNK